jgi:hypothetical protein
VAPSGGPEAPPQIHFFSHGEISSTVSTNGFLLVDRTKEEISLSVRTNRAGTSLIGIAGSPIHSKFAVLEKFSLNSLQFLKR